MPLEQQGQQQEVLKQQQQQMLQQKQRGEKEKKSTEQQVAEHEEEHMLGGISCELQEVKEFGFWEAREGKNTVGAAVAELLQPPCHIHEIAILPCSFFSVCCDALLPLCSLAFAQATGATARAATRWTATAAAEGHGSTGGAAGEEVKAGTATAAESSALPTFTAAASASAAAAAPVPSVSRVSPAEAPAAAASPHRALPPSLGSSSLAASCFFSGAQQDMQRQPQQQQQQRFCHGTQQKVQQVVVADEMKEDSRRSLEQQEQLKQQLNDGEEQQQHEQQDIPHRLDDKEMIQQQKCAAAVSPTHRATPHKHKSAFCPCVCIVPAVEEVGAVSGAAAASFNSSPELPTAAATNTAATAVTIGHEAPASRVEQQKWNLLLCCCCIPSIYASAASALSAAATACVQQPCSVCSRTVPETVSVHYHAAAAAEDVEQKTFETFLRQQAGAAGAAAPRNAARATVIAPAAARRGATREDRAATATSEGEDGAMMRATTVTGWIRLALLLNGGFPPALLLARMRLDAFVAAVAVASSSSSLLPWQQKQQRLGKKQHPFRRRQQAEGVQQQQQQTGKRFEGDEAVEQQKFSSNSSASTSMSNSEATTLVAATTTRRSMETQSSSKESSSNTASKSKERESQSSRGRSGTPLCWVCSSLAAFRHASLPATSEQQQQQAAQATCSLICRDVLLNVVRSFFHEELQTSALLLNEDLKSGVLWAHRRTVCAAAMHALLLLLCVRRKSSSQSSSDVNCSRNIRGSDKCKTRCISCNSSPANSNFGSSRSLTKHSPTGDSSLNKDHNNASKTENSCCCCSSDSSSSRSGHVCCNSDRRSVCKFSATPVEEATGAASLQLDFSDSLLVAAEENNSAAAVIAAEVRAAPAPQETVAQTVETNLTTKLQVSAACARGEEEMTGRTLSGDRSCVAAAAAEGKERFTVAPGARGYSAAAAEEEVDAVVVGPVRAAAAAPGEPAAEELTATTAEETGGISIAAVKTDEDLAAAAGKEGVAAGEDAVQAFYELIDAELLLIEQHASKRLHAYHPWEHLARLLPLWKQFEFSASAGRRCGNEQAAASHDAQESAAAAKGNLLVVKAGKIAKRKRKENQEKSLDLLLVVSGTASSTSHRAVQELVVRKYCYLSGIALVKGNGDTSLTESTAGTPGYHHTWRGSDNVTTLVSTASCRTDTRCLNSTSSTATRSSEELAASVKSLQHCVSTMKTVPHSLSSPQRALADETLLWKSGSTGIDNVRPCQRPAAAAVTASETYFLNQRCAANGDQLPATRSGIAAEEASTDGAWNVETANNVSETECLGVRREKGDVFTLEAATLALAPREIIAAAFQEAETAGMPATAGGAAGITASATIVSAQNQDAVAVDTSNAATTFDSTRKKKRQNDLCQMDGPKAPVAHTHVRTERETFVDGLHTIAPLYKGAGDDHEIEGRDGRGRKATEGYKGKSDGLLETGDTSVSGEEKKEERRAVKANGEEPQPKKLLVNEEEERTKKKRRTVNEMVDAFVQRQIGLLPQCRAPHHMLARRFYERLQSRMTQVNYCLSQVLSADVLAAALDTNSPGDAISRSSSVGLKLSTRSIPHLLSESTFVNASVAPSAADGTARTVAVEGADIPTFVCASELQLGGHNGDYFALSASRRTHTPVPSVAVLNEPSRGASDPVPVTRSRNTFKYGSTFTPYNDGAARRLDTMALPDLSSPAVPAVLFRTKEALLGRTHENETAADDADAALFGKKGLLSTQRTKLTAETGRLPSENGFLSILCVQEQLLTQYLEMNHEVIKLFPHLEAPWSGRSDLYSAYLRMWTDFVVNRQRRLFLYKPGDDFFLQETWKLPNKGGPHTSQQQREKHVQPQSGRDELCASPIPKIVLEVAVKCEVDQRFLLEADFADLSAERLNRLKQVVLSFGDAVEDHLKTVIRRELTTCTSLLPVKKQDQRNGRIRAVQSCVSKDLGTATRGERKITVCESVRRETRAEGDLMVRWVSRHQSRLCKELSRAIESVRRAAQEVKSRKLNVAPYFSVAKEAHMFCSSTT